MRNLRRRRLAKNGVSQEKLNTGRDAESVSILRVARHTTAIRESTSCGARVLLFYENSVVWADRLLEGRRAVRRHRADVWCHSDTWQTLHQICRLPFGSIIGGCLMIVQISWPVRKQVLQGFIRRSIAAVHPADERDPMAWQDSHPCLLPGTSVDRP